jgi:hypothetical protein
MRISIHGNDRGNAVLTALVLILAVSTTFIALVPRIHAVRRFAFEYKSKVLETINQKNEEVLNKYDLH